MMDEKNARLKCIRKLILSEKIESQETLLKKLEQEGFPVTQATLSRDLRQLKIVKVTDSPDRYRYTFLFNEVEKNTEQGLIDDFLNGFVSIDFSLNFALVKTIPGHAQSVAFAVDNLKIEGILGTIAGDDTILVVPQDGYDRARIMNALEQKIPGLKE